MKRLNIRALGTGLTVAVWLLLTAFAWFGAKQDISDTERRPLAQMPGLSQKTILDGSFMSDFESYSLDQFPLRDTFRQAKALMHYYVLGQKDNNGIYIADGSAAELAYPMDKTSVDHALAQFQKVYEKYLSGTSCRIYTTVVPDKGYYLAQENGYPAMDYDSMFSAVAAGMPWASYVDIADCLTARDYYRTDTHWRQERLLPVAQRLARAMDVTAPNQQDYSPVALERPFYGVYYGQAALPMAPDTVYLMESAGLETCRVYNYETGEYAQVYDRSKVGSKDLYDVFLSGPQSLLRLENPNAQTNRELIVFRDSYASSLIPLLAQSYRSITLVDLRYIDLGTIGRFLDFDSQDVLFLHSTLVLNKKLI